MKKFRNKYKISKKIVVDINIAAIINFINEILTEDLKIFQNLNKTSLETNISYSEYIEASI